MCGWPASARRASRRPKAKLREEPEARLELALCERLGKTRGELRALMSQDEWLSWLALYQIEAEERALQENKDRAKAKAAQKRR